MLYMADTKREHGRVFQMRVSDEFLATIDGWRRQQDDLPSRAEAVRRLVDKALDPEADEIEGSVTATKVSSRA